MLHHALRATGGRLQYIAFANATGSGTSVTCSVPSAARANDLLVAMSTQTSTTTVYTMGTPAGWTETLDTNGRSVTYLPSWDGTTTSYTFTKSGSSNPAVVIMVFRNAKFDVQGTISAGAASPIAPAITVSYNGSILVGYFSGLNGTLTYSTPTGFTEIYDGAIGLAISYKTGVAAGGSGTVTSTASGGTLSRGVIFSIKPRYT